MRYRFRSRPAWRARGRVRGDDLALLELVVELLGRSDGIGFKLQLFLQLFDVPDILAYALAFAGVVQMIEWTILRPIERGVGSWRR